VSGQGLGYDSIEADALEAIAHDGAGGFGRQAAAQCERATHQPISMSGVLASGWRPQKPTI